MNIGFLMSSIFSAQNPAGIFGNIRNHIKQMTSVYTDRIDYKIYE